MEPGRGPQHGHWTVGALRKGDRFTDAVYGLHVPARGGESPHASGHRMLLSKPRGDVLGVDAEHLSNVFERYNAALRG